MNVWHFGSIFVFSNFHGTPWTGHRHYHETYVSTDNNGGYNDEVSKFSYLIECNVHVCGCLGLNEKQ